MCVNRLSGDDDDPLDIYVSGRLSIDLHCQIHVNTGAKLQCQTARDGGHTDRLS